jgi:ParB family chromosome partitioning protein
VRPGERLERPSADDDARSDEPKTGSPAVKPTFSETLLERLSAHRTAALREALAAKPHAALTALVHTLALQTFYNGTAETCVDIRMTSAGLKTSAPDIGESKAAVALEARFKAWMQRLPPVERLWSWCAEQDVETKLDLLAFCAGMSVNAVHKRFDGGSVERLEQSHVLASHLALDMADWWQANGASYLSHVSKAQIAAAVAEAVSPDAAAALEGLKKETMVIRAEELLAGRRWLPDPLRQVSPTVDTESRDAAE